jgi:uncharacterized protein (TIGR02246 family)
MEHPVSQDERAIRALIEKWMAASKAGDLQTVLSLMAEDVVFMVPGRPPFGKAEFAVMSEAMKDMHVEGKSEIEDLKIFGDWAWLRNHLTIAVTPPGGETVRRLGYTLTILRKEPNGTWLLVRDANLLTTE